MATYHEAYLQAARLIDEGEADQPIVALDKIGCLSAFFPFRDTLDPDDFYDGRTKARSVLALCFAAAMCREDAVAFLKISQKPW